MVNPVQRLISILDLEQLDQNLFRGQSGNSLWQRVFGGHVIAQAVAATQQTVGHDRFIHSLHAYFIRPGKPQLPIYYEVERLRDGRSFSTRRAVAKQQDIPILTLSSSFQIDEDGLEYHRPMPDNIPQPETLMNDDHFDQSLMNKAPGNIRKYWNIHRPFIIRPLNLKEYLERKKHLPIQRSWFKLDGNIEQNRQKNASILAYLSDMTLLDTSLLPHGKSVFSKDIQPASLDHSMWFHKSFKLDDWFLYDLETVNTGNSRGLGRGYIYTRQGELVASVAQEGLMRQIG